MARRKPARRDDSNKGVSFESTMRHHRAAWRVERVAWALGALALLGALLGLFGDGPLSRAQGGSVKGLSVRYDRLLRANAPSHYTVDAGSAVVRQEVLRLRLEQALLDRIEIEAITPEPDQQQAGAGYTEFGFRVVSGAPVTIDFRFRPARFGAQAGHLSVDGAPPVRIRQFVYP